MANQNLREGIFKRLFSNLRIKYKLVILNEVTFEEAISLRLSRLNVLIVIILVSLLSVIFTIFIVWITPLKEYIPGYASVEQVKQVYLNELKADSLKTDIRQRNLYLKNFQNRILLGQDLEGIDSIDFQTKKDIDYTNIPDKKSEQDSLLRTEWEGKENYDIIYYPDQQRNSGISRFVFFTPIHGTLINGFDSKKSHYGVDILSKKDSPIKSALDGTVILSTWTFEGGYVIAIQHEDDLISVYKHNSTLLKMQGERVKAGDPIAIIGNTGEQSSGPHLHFEVWYHRNPVNPADFINFDY